MTAELARIDIAGIVDAIVTAWTDYPLVVSADNRTSIDYAKQVHPFLEINTEFISANQVELGENPLMRQYGQFEICIVTKEGSGLSSSTKLADFMVPFMERKNLVVLHTGAAELRKPRTLRGLVYFPVMTNFYYHR